MKTLFSAIIITGGNPSRNKVEVLHSNGSYWCSLADFPQPRSGHTQVGLLSCGGYENDIRTSCLSFTDGQWKISHYLQSERFEHSSWLSPQGVILLGGTGSKTTTEILPNEGGATPSFALKYIT